MNIYLAGVGGLLSAYLTDENLYKEANVLQAFPYCNSFTEKVVIPNSKGFMLDSGAFTFLSKTKGAVDWSDYVKRYASFINKNKVDLFFELDIDKLIGYDKVIYYRKMLENLTGKKVIPVWHKSRGLDEFKKMCQEYDYVAIGGIVTNEIKKEDYIFIPKLIDIAHKNGSKIHGLGFTKLSELHKYRFDSVDSSSWASGNRFGSISRFNGKTIVTYHKEKGKKISDSKACAIHNFKEWVKFADYAEKHL